MDLETYNRRLIVRDKNSTWGWLYIMEEAAYISKRLVGDVVIPRCVSVYTEYPLYRCLRCADPCRVCVVLK